MGFPYIPDQTFGAALALGVLAIWGTRHHLRSALQRALGRRQPSPAEQSDALSARAAFLGIAVCALALLIFLRAIGMSSAVAIATLAVYSFLIRDNPVTGASSMPSSAPQWAWASRSSLWTSW